MVSHHRATVSWWYFFHDKYFLGRNDIRVCNSTIIFTYSMLIFSIIYLQKTLFLWLFFTFCHFIITKCHFVLFFFLIMTSYHIIAQYFNSQNCFIIFFYQRWIVGLAYNIRRTTKSRGWRHYFGNKQALRSQIKTLLFEICHEVIFWYFYLKTPLQNSKFLIYGLFFHVSISRKSHF